MTTLSAISPEGVPLNAAFSLRATPEGFELTMESRSGKAEGGQQPRNRDYERLMGLVFRRAAALDADLTGAWVASAKTRPLSAAERLLMADAYPYPVHLPAVIDFETLRIRLSAAQGAIGREPDAKGPGNRNKRVTFAFRTPASVQLKQVEAAMVLGELPDDAVRALFGPSSGSMPAEPVPDLTRVQALLDRYEHATPRVRRRVQRQVERGPVGDIVKDLNRHRCQLCAALGWPAEGFRKRNGLPYVEAHHVDGVARGTQGVLRAANIITVCADHHRELHYGAASRIEDLEEHFRITVEGGTVTVAKMLLAAT